MAEAETETDSKYSNGKIYRLDYKELTYIGSTCGSLKDREQCHRNSLKCTSKLLYERAKVDCSTVIITLIEDYPCKSRTELTRREGYWQQQIECVNRYVAGRTDAESCKVWREANKEAVIEIKKAWYEANKEAVLERTKAYREASPTVSCECGGKYKQYHQPRHFNTAMHKQFIASKMV